MSQHGGGRDEAVGRGSGMRRSFAWAGGVWMAVAAAGTAVAVEETENQSRTRLEAALARQGIGTVLLGGQLAGAWNELAYQIAFAEDQLLTFKGIRAFAMMHLAMHDALNSIVPLYERYTYTGQRTVAHPVAAAAQAAHDVLVSQYPGEGVRIAAELTTWLDRVPDGVFETRGIDLGRATAAAILTARTGDGWDTPGSYEFGSGPGVYQTTPPWNGFVLQPGFRSAKPFALSQPSQFRPAGPPALGQPAYARAFREVKAFGAVDSKVRTEDQTAYALWWMEFAEASVNRLARRLVIRRHTHLWAAARMFAQLNTALFDGYVATWDSKYEFNHWRPYTAVRAAGDDGNPDTSPDPSWEPLRPTPPFPEYVSAHATGCAGSFDVLKRTFGDDVPFTMSTTTAPPGMPTRSFGSFTAAAAECADSRIRLGWHFRYATDAGLALGRAVARHVIHNLLRRQ